MALKVEISNYKSIKNTIVNLNPGLNVLIGPNGSGKTCILSALKFIRDVFRMGAAQALARGGGYKRVYHRGESEIKFSFSENYGKRIYRRRDIDTFLKWEITMSQAGEEQIASLLAEKISVSGKINGKIVQLFSIDIDRTNPKTVKSKSYLCSHDDFGRDLFKFWSYEYKSRNKKQIYDTFLNKVVRNILKRSKKDSDKSIFPILAPLDNVFEDIYFQFLFLNEYNILPDIARASTEQLPFAQMFPNGGSVSEVIHALKNEHFHKLEQANYLQIDDFYSMPQFYFNRYRHYRAFPFRRRIGRTRKRAPIQESLDNINQELSAAVRPITSVSIEVDPTNGRRFVVFKAENDTFYPEEVSDGTVKWLCILVSLFVPFSRVYLLEEPENFLHPWMQQRLVDIMRDQAKLHKTIFLLSSHSSTILNACYPNELLIVRQDEDGTKILEIEDSEEIKEVLEDSDFHLGDLWVSGVIGGVPSNE